MYFLTPSLLLATRGPTSFQIAIPLFCICFKICGCKTKKKVSPFLFMHQYSSMISSCARIPQIYCIHLSIHFLYLLFHAIMGTGAYLQWPLGERKSHGDNQKNQPFTLNDNLELPVNPTYRHVFGL